MSFAIDGRSGSEIAKNTARKLLTTLELLPCCGMAS